MTNPVELAFMRLCDQRGIRYSRPDQEGGRVDFYLPDFEMYVEVKAYSSDRLHAQLESIDAGNNAAMVLIGIKAVTAFGAMLAADDVELQQLHAIADAALRGLEPAPHTQFCASRTWRYPEPTPVFEETCGMAGCGACGLCKWKAGFSHNAADPAKRPIRNTCNCR